jgi:hypothetical protein
MWLKTLPCSTISLTTQNQTVFNTFPPAAI